MMACQSQPARYQYWEFYFIQSLISAYNYNYFRLEKKLQVSNCRSTMQHKCKISHTNILCIHVSWSHLFDSGPKFTSTCWMQFMKFYNIKHCTIINQWSKANAQTEPFKKNQWGKTIRSAKIQRKSCKQELFEICRIYMTSHCTTKFTSSCWKTRQDKILRECHSPSIWSS